LNGLDNFLFKSILQTVRNELDTEKIKKIEQKFQNEQGLKFSDLFDNFGEIKNSLFEFESELKKIEDNVLRSFLTVESNGSSETWIVIRNRYMTEIILKTFADEDKKTILSLTRDAAETIPKILMSCNLPNTSGYRKMNQLIKEGFVTPVGLVETFEGKRAIVYRTVIQQIQIIINKSEIITKILVPKEIIASSQILRTITIVIQGNSNRFSN
jgi:hypothetical protein